MAKVDLEGIVAMLEGLPPTASVWLHTETGETYLFDEEYMGENETGIDFEDPAWLSLPDSFEIHEWEIMRDFATARSNPDERQQLYDAIHGGGAFRMFRATVDRLGVLDAWYTYRTEAVTVIARDWLDEKGIAYDQSGES